MKEVHACGHYRRSFSLGTVIQIRYNIVCADKFYKVLYILFEFSLFILKPITRASLKAEKVQISYIPLMLHLQ